MSERAFQVRWLGWTGPWKLLRRRDGSKSWARHMNFAVEYGGMALVTGARMVEYELEG